jgi:hypothetical protein
MARQLLALVLGIICLALQVFAEAKPKVVALDFEKREIFGVEPSIPGTLNRRKSTTAVLFNAQGDLLYLINVTVGTPPQQFSLQLDTGSSDIWVSWTRSSGDDSEDRSVQVLEIKADFNWPASLGRLDTMYVPYWAL